MSGPFFAIAGVLLLSGASKLVAPESAAAVLRTLGLSRPAMQVGFTRLIGLGEIVLGVTGIVVGGRAAATAIAAAYVAFAVVSELLRRRPDAIASCGCFGAKDTPPSLIHTAVNGLAFALAGASVVWPPTDLLTTLGDQPLAGVVFLALVCLAGYLFYLAFTVLPEVFAPPAAEVPVFGVRS